MSLVVASKRTFGTAFTNQHAVFQIDQRRYQRIRSNGNDENISNLNSGAEFDYKIHSLTNASVKDMREVLDKYIRCGDTRNFPIR